MRRVILALVVLAGLGWMSNHHLTAAVVTSWEPTDSSPGRWFADWSGPYAQWQDNIYIVGSRTSTYYTGDSWMATILPQGGLDDWQRVTNPSASRVISGTSVAANGYMYTIGGEPQYYSQLRTVEFAPIRPDGTLGTWQTTTQLPAALGRCSAVTHNDWLYVLGGYTGWNFPTTVYRSQIRADGTLGAWITETSQTTASHPIGEALVVGDYIYAIAGQMHGYQSSVVERARSNADGSLSAWETQTPLPTTLEAGGAAVVNGRLFVVGGAIGPYGENPTSAVWSAPINPLDYSLGAWESELNVPVAGRAIAP